MESSPSPPARSCPLGSIEIREPHDIDDYTAIVTLQEAVWGPRAVVGVPHLIAVSHTGGTVLLARDAAEGDRAVGFCYGFVGLDVATDSPPEPILWSHMLAVIPTHRGRGLGRQLKLAQAERARHRGLSRVLWTFDPLEARNAHLNLSRLGAVASRYSINRYGPMDDELNVGLDTDRLVADWWVGPNAPGNTDPGNADPGNADLGGNDPGRRRHPAVSEPSLLLNPDPPYGPVLDSTVVRDHPGTAQIAIPVDDWRADPDRATAWRMNVRASFTVAVDAGFTAVDVHAGQPLAYYRLERL